MGSFYCQKVCGSEDFSIEEWNEAFRYCNEAGIEGVERDKILNPELFPCKNQCFDCCAIVGETRQKTQKLINKNKIMEKKYFTFGEVIEALKLGLKVQREGWNGKGMFLYYVPESNYPAVTDIAKETFPNGMVPYCAYIAMKTADNKVVPWLASQTDILAEDWLVIQ